MTTGQIMFYSGAGLMALAVVLAIIFVVKKPQYKPDHAVYSAADSNTQRLRNGYPTDPLTIRRETGAAGSGVRYEETERITAEQTEKNSDTALSQATEVIDGQLTEKLADEQLTEKLRDIELTEKLPEEADLSTGTTELL